MVKLPQVELQLMDWLYCGQSEHASPALLGPLMDYQDLRERIWRALLLAALDDKPGPSTNSVIQGEASIELSDAEMVELLALIPTTFRWGTGDDVGYPLKCRIAGELWGAEIEDQHAKDRAFRELMQEVENAASPSPSHPTQPDPDVSANVPWYADDS